MVISKRYLVVKLSLKDQTKVIVLVLTLVIVGSISGGNKNIEMKKFLFLNFSISLIVNLTVYFVPHSFASLFVKCERIIKIVSAEWKKSANEKKCMLA